MLERLAEHGLIKGERIGIDASTMEANAALRMIVRRDSGEGYRAMLERLAKESGIATPTAEDLVRLDRKRKGKRLSNREWTSPTDPEARIAKLKDGRTIEEAYQLDVKGYRAQGNNWRLGKGKPPLTRMTPAESYAAYKALWQQWARENPELMAELREKSAGRPLTDMFAATEISQARALAEILAEPAQSGPAVSQPPAEAAEPVAMAYEKISDKIYKPAHLAAVDKEIARLEREGQEVPKALKAKRTRLRKLTGWSAPAKTPKRKYVRQLAPLKREAAPAASGAPVTPAVDEQAIKEALRGKRSDSVTPSVTSEALAADPFALRGVTGEAKVNIERKAQQRVEPVAPEQDNVPTVPRATRSPRDAEGKPIPEPGGVRKPGAPAAKDTRPTTGVPYSKRRAAVRKPDGEIIHNPLVREANLGTKQEGVPPAGTSAWARLKTRLADMPWVKQHLLVKAENPNSWTTVTLPDGSKVERTVEEHNKLIIADAAAALEDYVAQEMLGQNPADRRARRAKKGLDDDNSFRSLMHRVVTNVPDRLIEETLAKLQLDDTYQLGRHGRTVSRDNGVGLAKKGASPNVDLNPDERQPGFEEYAGENHALGDERESSIDDGEWQGVKRYEGKRVTPEQDRWWTKFALSMAGQVTGVRARRGGKTSVLTEGGIPLKPKIFYDEDGKETGRVTVEQMMETLRTRRLPADLEGEWPSDNSPEAIADWIVHVVAPDVGAAKAFYEAVDRFTTEADRAMQQLVARAREIASLDPETGEIDTGRADEMERRLKSDAQFWAELGRSDPEAYAELMKLQRDIEDDGRARDRENAEKAAQEERRASVVNTKPGESLAEREAGIEERTEAERARLAAREDASRISDQAASELPAEIYGGAMSIEEALAQDEEAGSFWTDDDIQAKPVESLVPFMQTPEQGVALYRVHMAARDEVLQVSEAPAVDYLNAILAQIPKDHALQRRVVEALLRALKDTGLVVEVDGSELEQRGSAGEYHPMTNRILFSPKYLKSVWGVPLLLHELVHSATYHALRSNPAFRAQMLSMMHGVKNAAKGTSAEGHYGFTSVDEFLSEALSNPDFQMFLASVGRNQSLWSRFVRAVARMLGLSGTDTYDDMLTAVIEATLPQLRAPKKAKYTRDGTLALPAAEIRQTLDAMSRTAPARAARLAAARNYRAAGQALTGGLKKGFDKVLDIAEPLLVANWQLARAGTRELADVFFRQSGTRKALGVMNRAALREMAFRIAWHRMFKNVSAEDMAAAWAATERARAAGLTREQLAAENEVAGQMQTFFERMDLYIRSAAVRGYAPVEGIYLPQVHDIGAITQRFDEYVQFLTDGGFEITDPATGETRNISEREATAIATSMTTPHDHATHADLPYAGSLMHRVITDPRYQAAAREAGWLHGNPTQIVQYYIASLTKQIEFERRFGAYMIDLSAEPDENGEVPMLELPRAAELRNADYRIMPHLRKIYGGEIKSTAAYNRAFDLGLRTGLIEPQGVDANGNQLYSFYQRDLGLEIEIGTALRKYGNDKKAKKAAEERIRTIISGYMGQLGADMNPTRRKAQQWVLMAQTITTLAFSTISSIPELALLAAMAPDRAAFVDAVRKVVTDREGTKALLEDIGFGWDQMINVALLDNTQYNVMDGMPRKIIDKFFVLNGQHAWTHVMRALSAQMAMSHFTRLAEQNDTATLALHGLTPGLVRDWQEHRTMIGLGGNGLAVADVHPVVAALHNFIDDRVIMPDAASRPTFMNDPKWALVGQLKGFFYAYGSKVMGGMWRRQSAAYQAAVARGDRSGAALAKAAVPYLVLGSMGVVLAALAGELKERLKYDIWGEERPAWREKHGMEYMFYQMRQSGMFGPMDMAVNLFNDDSTGLMGLLGPAAGHLEVALQHGVFSEEFARRSTPVLGQLPGARARLAELVGYGDDDEL